MSLSVCLVTRNEENNMGRVLRSVAGVADEVIVADTGSTDRTAEVATSFGAKVTPFAWQDDFAAARNHALAQATGDWVLWLNPDEELLPAGCERLPAYLAAEDVLGYVVRVQEQLQGDRPDNVAETHQPRLFRREAGVRYRSRLHPSFAEPLEDLARRLGKLVGAADVTLRRHAYLSVPTPDKLRWAARLLELELHDRPGQIHYLVEYGRTLLLLNDPRGHEVLAEAVEQILPSRDAPVPPVPAAGPLLEYLLTVAPEQYRGRLPRAEARQLALRWFGQTPPVVWALAQDRFQAADYAGAAGLLENLLRMGRSGAYDHSEAFRPDVIGAAALLNLGVCYIRLGELDRAEDCFRQLLTDPVHQAQARRNYALVQTLRGRR
jgi:tetratricopeptide (TPR) repeat protein